MLARLILLCGVAGLLLTGCSPPPPQFVGEPELTMNPSGRTPLSGLLTLTTDQPAKVTLVINDGENQSTVTPEKEFTTEHAVPVLGMRADRDHTIYVVATNEDGIATPQSHMLTVRTPPLPDTVPPVQVNVSRPAAMEPGVTLVPLFRWFEGEIDREYGLMIMIDARGDVVWVYEAPQSVLHGLPLANGNIVYNSSDAEGRAGFLHEVDMLGNVVNRWHTTGTPKNVPDTSIPVDTDTFHHDTVEMPSGNFLVLSTEVRTVEDFPTDLLIPDSPKVTRPVIGDVLVEMRRDGTKVREWKFFDLIDPQRVGMGSTDTGFYKMAYEGVLEEPAPDWTHMNGMFYDAERDKVLVSSNHLSVVLQLDLGSGQIDWLLGNHEAWREPWSDLLLEPKGELMWSWHHHAPKLTPDGTILLYDNGPVRQLPPFAGMPDFNQSFSRAVEYRVDEANRTVEQVWSYGGPGDEQFFSGFISQASWMPETGNVLVTNGGRVRLPDGGQGMPGMGHHWISLAEVTHTTPAEKVWEVVIDDPAVSWTAFRTERISGLYR